MSQTLSCPVPDNLNPLSPNGFQLTIAKLPGVSYFCQEADLPSVSLPNQTIMNPLVDMHFAGTQLKYNPLSVTFMVDSEMDNYAAMLGWMTGLGFPENYTQYTQFVSDQKNAAGFGNGSPDFSAGTLIILGSNNKQIRTLEFVDLLPISMSSLVFSATNTDVKYLMCNATFVYDYFILT